MTLSKDQILAAVDLEVRDVDVPEWGGTVKIRALSGRERDSYESSLRIQRGNQIIADTTNLRAKLVGRAIVDDNGERVFTDKDINALGGKSAAVLDRLFDVVAEMSGLNDEADEDAEKNSPSDDPSEASTSS